ncbi:MAG: GNAT family N-acetyltransferase [Firmicutes bacterium]|nr:GNAT family N-acetyltransferase [Bacillota bacterium]
MTEIASEKHYGQIVEIWQEAFGDETGFIEKFLSDFAGCTAVCQENGKVLGIVSLLPVSCGKKRGRYIYALAVSKTYRGMGIGKSLVGFAKEHIKKCREAFMVLVPGSEELFDFYEKQDFFSVSCTEKKYITANDRGFFAEEISAAQYYEIRRSFFEDKQLIEWSKDSLEKIARLNDGYFVKISGNGICAAAFATIEKGGISIDELLQKDGDCAGMAAAVEKLLSCRVRRCAVPDFDGAPSVMVYPKQENIYFNIAMQ